MNQNETPVNYAAIPCASPLALRALRPCARALLDLVRALSYRGACWASISWFSAQLGYCRRSICYAIAQLVEAQLLIRTERHTAKGKQRTSTCVIPRATRPLPIARGATDCTQLPDTFGNLEITRSATRSPAPEERPILPEEQTLLDAMVTRSGAPAPRAKHRVIGLLLHFLAKGETFDALCEQARRYYQRAASTNTWTVPLVTWLASTRLSWRDYTQKARPWWAAACPVDLDWRRCKIDTRHEERVDARRPWRIVRVESTQWIGESCVVESPANRTRFEYARPSCSGLALASDTPPPISHQPAPQGMAAVASIWECSRIELCARLRQIGAIGADLAIELEAMHDCDVDLGTRRAIAETLAQRAGFDAAEIAGGLVVSFLPTWRPEFAAVWGGEYAAYP